MMNLMEQHQFLVRLLPSNTQFTNTPSKQIEVRNGLLNKLGLDKTRAAVFWTDGEAMKPTIDGECEILIDRADTSLIDGKIYVLSIGHRTLIRRVQLLLNGIILVADNPDYSNMEVIGKDLDSIQVIGRVRYIGKLLP